MITSLGLTVTCSKAWNIRSRLPVGSLMKAWLCNRRKTQLLARLRAQGVQRKQLRELGGGYGHGVALLGPTPSLTLGIGRTQGIAGSACRPPPGRRPAKPRSGAGGGPLARRLLQRRGREQAHSRAVT